MHDSGVTVQTLIESEGPTSESWDPIMYISENGLPRLKMMAAYMARYETPDSTYMVLSTLDESSGQVRVDIFDVEGDSSATVYSNLITYFERDRRFVAEGNVVVRARDDRWLYAEHLAWSEKVARIQTPGFSTIHTPKQTLSGFGLDADENLNDFSMTKVSGKILRDDE